MSHFKYLNSAPITTYKEFIEVSASHSSGILLIKPRVLLEKIENDFGIPTEMRFQVPSSKIGSILTLEATVLFALLKIISPAKIFEFGTFLGYSTALFLNNSDAKVFSIDLPTNEINKSVAHSPDADKLLTDDRYNDEFLSAWSSEHGEVYLANLRNNMNLKLIKCDSQEFNPGSFDLIGSVDFLFVDGGHSYAIIESDTQKAFQMMTKTGIVIWHDFNSKLHSQVTEYLASLSSQNLIVHIESTMLAFSGPGLSSLGV
jgi:hypothetical protein